MKRKLLLVYVLMAFVLLCTNVYAMVTAELNLVANKTAVKPGEDVIVTVELNNLSAPVASVEGYINIDENVLESISSNMVVTNSDGKIEINEKNKLSFAFNPTALNADYDVIFNTNASATRGNDVFFVMDFAENITSNAEIMKLKYKVKEGTADADIANAVKLDCVVVYSDNDRSGELNESLTIKVSAAASEGSGSGAENENNAGTNENTSGEGNTAGNTNTNTNTNTNNTNTNTNNTNTNNANTNTNNTNTNTNRNTNTNNTNRTNTNTNTNKTTNTNTKDNTVSGTTMPAAGLRTVMIPMIIFMVLAYVSYTKYVSYKDV